MKVCITSGGYLILLLISNVFLEIIYLKRKSLQLVVVVCKFNSKSEKLTFENLNFIIHRLFRFSCDNFDFFN